MINVITKKILLQIVIISQCCCWFYLSYGNTNTTSQFHQSTFSSHHDTALTHVTISGVDSLTRGDIEHILLSKQGGIINEGLIDHDLKAIKDYLQEQGWWNSSVSAEVDSVASEAGLTFNVTLGNLIVFGTVIHAYKDNTPVLDLQDDTTHYGKPFTRHALDSIIGTALSLYMGNGYPQVTVTPILYADDDTVSVNLHISSGERAVVDSLSVSGLSRTSDKIILRELKHILGKPAGSEVVSEARSLLQKLTYVREENAPTLTYDTEGNCILALSLADGRQGSFDGVIGYQPTAEGKKGELVGKIDLALDNLFGTGRASRVRWENLGQKSEDVELHYLEPWLFGYPYSGSLVFLQEERGYHGYTRTTFISGLERSIGRLHVKTALRYEKVSADTLHSSHVRAGDVSLSYSTLDTPQNPLRGISYTVHWTLGSKTYRFRSTNTRSDRLSLDLDHYIPTRSRQTVTALIRYRRVTIPSENLSPSDRYLIGGASTIRGYLTNQFPALEALWTSFEYRFITGDTSRVFIFTDIGYLSDKERIGDQFRKTTRTLTGYGFGIRLRSQAGTLGFDYGLGRGDSLGDGKLHVMLATEF